MSSAHRPTWSPAIGKAGKEGSKVISARDLAGHTRLKFRQAGQGNTSEIARRDLKLELIEAERESQARKAKGQSGLAPHPNTVGLLENGTGAGGDDEEEKAAKRRKVLEAVGGLDADDEDDEDEQSDGEGKKTKEDKGKGKAVNGDDESHDEEEDSDDDDDDEDETAELLRELEKIKRERAEERERIERERAATEQTSREEEIATGNPLLNLQSALGYNASPTPSSISTSTGTTSSGFGVKRRWDDDVIFKNQARGTTEGAGKATFVNDLLRTEFHKRFMKRFIA